MTENQLDQSPSPTEVYKYLCPARADFFQAFKLRFSQPEALNDPYECLPACDNIDPSKFFDRIIARNPNALRHLTPEQVKDAKAKVLSNLQPEQSEEQCLAIYRTKVNNTLGILSLCKRPDSIVMWAHYAEQHKGFVLGFNRSHPFFEKQKTDWADTGTLREVTYGMNRINVDFAGEVTLKFDIFLRKNRDWDYEEEVRLIRGLHAASELRKVPGKPDICLFDIPKTCVSSVIFGLHCSPDLRSSIEHKVKSDVELKDVRLFKAKLDLKEFKMRLIPIPR